MALGEPQGILVEAGAADYFLDGLQLPNYYLVSLKDFAKNRPCFFHVTCSMTIQDFRVVWANLNQGIPHRRYLGKN